MQRHLARCPSCRRYESVLEHGAAVLRSLPQPELREDFEPRLRHRLYHVEDERAVTEHTTSGAPALTVVGIAILLTAVAWTPVLRGGATVVQLEPIVVDRAPVPARSQPAVSAPRPRPVSSERSRELELDLWEDMLLWEYSPLRQRYEPEPRHVPVGFDGTR